MIPAGTAAIRDRAFSEGGGAIAGKRRLAASVALAILATGCDGADATDPSSTGDAQRAAVDACRTAIASQMGLAPARLAIREVTRWETGVNVRVTVDGAAAPWECRTDFRNQIQAVTFTGIEADN